MMREARLRTERPWRILFFKVMKVELDGRFVRHVDDARGRDPNSDHQRVADLLLGQTQFQGFLNVAFQSPFTPRHQ